jgi:bacillithiol biosynthesis cysteine-adding enzyme BshC
MLAIADLTAFPALFRDYINHSEKLKPYYQTHYTTASLEVLIAQQQYRKIDRNLLHKILTEQYKNIPLYPSQKQNLLALKDENTFTITTGHQLCIFGGPWFVAYKILATVAYARTLQSQSDRYKIVPIFWLASEDHDVAEIQTLYTDTQRIYYPTDYQGITGNLPLQNIENTLETLLQTLGKGLYANHIKQVLSECYNSNITLSQATRLFIQKLFGHLGLLVLDANVPELKAQFLPFAEKEIKENITYTTVQKTIDELQQSGYKTYANPNKVNLFYVYQNNMREKWSDSHSINPKKPQHISPNVLLRPVYQELILPNLAYVGGPTEIAYWLQLKTTFEAFEIPFPVLVPRYFGLQLPAKYLNTLKKHTLDLATLLNTPKEVFMGKYFEKRLSESKEIIELEQQLQHFSTALLHFAQNQKLGLEQSAMATVIRIEKQWKHFYTKTRKETQKREQIFTQKINDLYDVVFPFSNWQERTLSYLSVYAVYGNTLWEHILQKPVTEPYFWIWET